jgi:hypothetical protein
VWRQKLQHDAQSNKGIISMPPSETFLDVPKRLLNSPLGEKFNIALMTWVSTPKEKIEKDHYSKSNCTNKIPFRIHKTSRLWNYFIKPRHLPNISERCFSRLAPLKSCYSRTNKSEQSVWWMTEWETLPRKNRLTPD